MAFRLAVAERPTTRRALKTTFRITAYALQRSQPLNVRFNVVISAFSGLTSKEGDVAGMISRFDSLCVSDKMVGLAPDSCNNVGCTPRAC